MEDTLRVTQHSPRNNNAEINGGKNEKNLKEWETSLRWAQTTFLFGIIIIYKEIAAFILVLYSYIYSTVNWLCQV